MKMIRTFLILMLLVVGTMEVSAQKDYAKSADLAFNNLKYYQAIEMYKKAYTKEKRNDVKARILFQIGECYRLKENDKLAAVWYEKAIKAKYIDKLAHFHLANIYKAEGNYDDAIKEYNKYKTAVPEDKRADEGIESCNKSKEWKEDPSRIIVSPLPLLNSEEYDFSPIFSDKKNQTIYFTSTRQGSTGQKYLIVQA